MTGLALPVTELPSSLIARPILKDRFHARGDAQEVQFHWWQTPALLPVRLHGRLELVAWGCKHRRGPLPYGGWIDEGHVEAGALAAARPEPVVIPAALGFDRGVWYLISEGVQGVALRGAGGPVVYVLIRPATNYYRNMTEQNAVMPVLVNQTI